MNTNQDKGNTTQEKRHNPWMWIIIAIAAPLLMLVMAIAPLVLTFLWLSILMILPEGSDPVYDGIKLRVSEKKVQRIYIGYEINVPKTLGERDSRPTERAPLPQNFYILVLGEAKALADVRPADLLAEGFEESHGVYFAGGHLGSSATFRDDEVRTLHLNGRDHGTLKFSSSPTGPFFSLPVSFSEFQKQFGKPVRWEKRYRSRQFAP